MKRFSIISMAVFSIFISFFLIPASQCMEKTSVAFAADQDEVSITVAKMEKGDTSKPGEVLYSYEVSVTNISTHVVKFDNNNFMLVDDKGAKYGVTRYRFKDHITLEPRKTANCDRIYFAIPDKAKPKALVLHKRKQVLGKTALSY